MSENTKGTHRALAFQKFKKDLLGMGSLFFIISCGLAAMLSYFIAPDNSSNANSIVLEIHSRPPGFQTTIISLPKDIQKKQSLFSFFLYGNKNAPTAIPIENYTIKDEMVAYTPFGKEESTAQKNIPVSAFKGKKISDCIQTKTFYFGTDKYGRDLLSRLLIGTRISFFIGFIAVFISLLIGIPIGAIAGYYGGKVDSAILFLINVTWSIPTLLLVIAITLLLGKGFWQVFIAVGLTMWVEVARIVRGQVLSVKELQYVEAAKVLGYSDWRIIFKHILPNILAPVIVISAANFAAAILIESGLSFLGIGAQPPIPSWGGMIKAHYNYIIIGKAYLAVLPGLAIMLLVMAFMLVGNSLRDALDVRN